MTSRDAALRAVCEEIGLIVGKFPGFEPESLKLQPAMVNVHKLQEWLRAIEAALALTPAEREALEVALDAIADSVDLVRPSNDRGVNEQAAATIRAMLAERSAK